VSLRSSPYSTAAAEIPGAKSPADLGDSTCFVLFGKWGIQSIDKYQYITFRSFIVLSGTLAATENRKSIPLGVKEWQLGSQSDGEGFTTPSHTKQASVAVILAGVLTGTIRAWDQISTY
jgi:hypothetical protein